MGLKLLPFCAKNSSNYLYFSIKLYKIHGKHVSVFVFKSFSNESWEWTPNSLFTEESTEVVMYGWKKVPMKK
jgi:hypothetical protein